MVNANLRKITDEEEMRMLCWKTLGPGIYVKVAFSYATYLNIVAGASTHFHGKVFFFITAVDFLISIMHRAILPTFKKTGLCL